MFLYELVTFTIFFLLLVSAEHSDSCVGDNACTDGLHVGKGSCNGIDACFHFGDRLSNSINYHMINIPDNSCNGDQACAAAHRISNVSVASGTCNGEYACDSVGRNIENSASAKIKYKSCLGEGACTYAAQDRKIEIGINSCIRDESCCYAASGEKSKVVIGDNSCRAFDACSDIEHLKYKIVPYHDGGDENIFYNAETTTRIEKFSCNGKNACQGPSSTDQKLMKLNITIGDFSCNCKNCCRCLGPNDIVPKYSCNYLGADQCCKNETEKGTMDLLGPSSLCEDDSHLERILDCANKIML